MKPGTSIKPSYILLFILAAALAVPIITSLAQITSEKADIVRPTPTPTPDRAALRSTFPSVAYDSHFETNSARRSRSSKYDKYKVLNQQAFEDSEEVAFLDWLPSSAALPIDDSQLVILGRVKDAKAYLSEKKKSVYSEFKVEVEKVFKDSLDTESERRKYLTIERDGGVVLFPNGFRTWYFVSGQAMPVVGERYLFFLTNVFPQYGYRDKDLYLLTGYHLRNGVASPLDFADGGTHPTAKQYNGQPETKLLSDLEKSISSQPSRK